MAQKVNPRLVGKKPKNALMTVRVPRSLSEWFDAFAEQTGMSRNDLMKGALAAFSLYDAVRQEGINLIIDPATAHRMNMDGKPEMSEDESREIDDAVQVRQAAQHNLNVAQQKLVEAIATEREKKSVVMQRHAAKNMPPAMKEAMAKKQQEAQERHNDELFRSAQEGLS